MLVLAYSHSEEAGELCAWVPSELIRYGVWACYDAIGSVGASAFRDGIHPSVEGNRRLAEGLLTMISALAGKTNEP